MTGSRTGAARRGAPRLAVALVVAGGAVWVFSAVAYSFVVATCFSCASAVVAAGVDTSDYSAAAVRILAWDDCPASRFLDTSGLG